MGTLLGAAVSTKNMQGMEKAFSHVLKLKPSTIMVIMDRIINIESARDSQFFLPTQYKHVDLSKNVVDLEKEKSRVNPYD